MRSVHRDVRGAVDLVALGRRAVLLIHLSSSLIQKLYKQTLKSLSSVLVSPLTKRGLVSQMSDAFARYMST